MNVEYFTLTDKDEKYLKSLLGIAEDDTSKDISIKFSLEDAFEIIQEHCNTNGVAKPLYNTMFRIAIDLYRNENIGSEDEKQVIESISEGDTKIGYKSSSENLDQFKKSLLNDYKSNLNKYRKVRW